jgi:hypothetical protein
MGISFAHRASSGRVWDLDEPELNNPMIDFRRCNIEGLSVSPLVDELRCNLRRSVSASLLRIDDGLWP